MTPKEKAMELVCKYDNSILSFLNDRQKKENAKRCALICVEEIVNFDLKAKNESQFIIERRIDEYWQEVKTEIEKL